MATTAGAPPGSGANFKALSSKLAARGAHNPGALAAWIGRRKYGKKGFAKLGAHSHANGDRMYRLDFAGNMRQCPSCGYRADDADFAIDGGIDGTSSPSQPGELRTPQPSLPTGSGTAPLTVRGAGSPNMGLANGRGRSISLSRRMPVRTPGDLLVSRQPDGSAIVRHRQGASEIGKLRPMGDGTWQSVVDEHGLTPGRSQRAALAEMIGVYNSTTVTPDRAAQPLVPAPVQTPLMQQYGVQAIRLAGDDDGDDDDGMDNGGGSSNGLTPRGQGIYKKLCGKGVSPKVAMAMAKRAQTKTAGSFGGK